ncbi:DUF4262 domain-containing protein [Vibrio parahaemolyticus]|uniref:DUF4262 domain-containing protein n=1 Tax=Vibrio chagasii TaxID=170679 RepID=A0A2S7VNZ3_9VIBR|nr:MULTISPECIES: DUF4262 domain-containing protein [Vibrio]PQJ63532.1 hypothetical protein BTO10_01560 [Vibrio chagasii]TPA20790.1 DUF4262 domain-containing protein [Vibrio parahaemolyticus]
MDQYEEKALKDIEQYGCHILHVMEEGEYPGFSYSIGIEKTSSQPEIIITGLNQEVAHWIVNEYNNRVKAGEIFKPDEYYSGFLEGFDITFKEVSPEYYAEYFGWANWLYKGNNFKVLQFIYPDTSGVWPWDSEASADFKWFLPKLYAN